MWLDRFSAHSTPAGTPPPQGRAYSPAPRRPTRPSAPGLPPRSSSLTLLTPASSSSSLPSTARLPNGSARRPPNHGAPPDVPDPVQVLESILGAPLRTRATASAGVSEERSKPEEVVQDIDFGGLSLQQFVEAKAPTSQPSSPVHTRSAQTAEEYVEEKDRFEDLHRSIAACDEVLRSVETYLTNFQSDLGLVSAEIESLQSRSIALNTKLENRKVVEKHLSPAVEDVTFSPAVVKKIAEGPVDEGFVRALGDLEKRSKTLGAKSKYRHHVKAFDDTKPLVDDLTNKAVERVRDYIVAQIKAIRSPSINAQIIQQQAFLQYKDLFAFLCRHQPQLAREICRAYINTMRWYYLNHFTRYRKALEKLKLHVLDRHGVLGQEDGSKRGALLSNAKTPASHDTFALGRRAGLLKNPTANALTAYLAEEEKSGHHLEVPFRSFNLALIDNASFEYTFLTSYFGPLQNYHAIARTFTSIFEPTLGLGQALTKQLTESTTDTLGILLCVRLNQHFAFELQRRKVPAVEGYINATNMLLWPRFQQIMDQHCESLRKLGAALPARPSASAAILASSSASAQSTAPHPTTQKFANLVHGILSLSSEAGDDEPVSNSLGRLRAEFEAYLTRLSKATAEARKRERFLFNNYSLVCTILTDAQGRLADEIRSHFAALRDAFDK